MKENMMNVARKMIFVSIGCFACVAPKAQVNCIPGANNDQAGKLICQVPFVTGAVTNGGNTTGAVQAASIFNGPIGAQLSQLPLATSAPGSITLLDASGNPQPYQNLGPILLDRPETVGLGHFLIGASAQQFTFNHLDGIPIGSIPFVYTQTSPGQQFPVQFVSQTEHVSLKVNQYVLLATYGIGKKTDLSVIVPFSRVSIGASTLNQTTYYLTTDNRIGFTANNSTTPVPGSASGVGDVTVNIKQQLWNGGESRRGSFATGFAMRFQTGDPLNYLGSGAYGFNIYGLIAYKTRLSPHAKIAYQWNTKSVLLNPTGQGPNLNLPGGAQYGGGVDFALNSYLTVSSDILANEFVNSPYITPTCQTIPASSVNTSTPVCGTSSSTSVTLTALAQSTVTYTTVNYSAGLKWRPFGPNRKVGKNVIVYGNVLYQLNNVGLRADASPSGGISWSFNAPLK
jgi:hypothetical protein